MNVTIKRKKCFYIRVEECYSFTSFSKYTERMDLNNLFIPNQRQMTSLLSPGFLNP